VVHLLGGQRDRVDQLDRVDEVAGVEAGMEAVDQHPPVGQLLADQLLLGQRALRVGRGLGPVAHSRHLLSDRLGVVGDSGTAHRHVFSLWSDPGWSSVSPADLDVTLVRRGHRSRRRSPQRQAPKATGMEERRQAWRCLSGRVAVLGRGPRAEEAHRRLLVVISTVDPAVVASSPAGSDHNYTLVCEEPDDSMSRVLMTGDCHVRICGSRGLR
jgi:hypothetical protein